MSLPTQNKRVVKEEKEISCESATPLFIYPEHEQRPPSDICGISFV